jgi:hypothetical protein
MSLSLTRRVFYMDREYNPGVDQEEGQSGMGETDSEA